MIKTDFFKNIDTEEKAYWFGFIAADGCILKNLKQIFINLSIKDREHLQSFANIFKLEVKDYKTFDKRTKKEYFGTRLILSSKDMCSDLIIKGIGTKKSLTLTSNVFDCIPENMIHHFVRGYFDGDGYIGFGIKNEARMVIVGTEDFLQKIKNILLLELNLNDVKIINNDKVFTLGWGGNTQIIKIRSWLYKDSTISLSRKKDIFDRVVFGKKTKSSKYRGVHWSTRNQKWLARIYFNKATKTVGRFNNEQDAALAYNDFIAKHNIPKYKLNTI